MDAYKDKRKTDFVIATHRLQIGSRMYAMSHYLTWMSRNLRDDPVQSMKGNSTIFILHQDLLLIKDIKQECASIFKKVVNWDKKSENTLKNLMALINYEFAHGMFWNRGTAAIQEWLEMVIYLYHNFEVFYKKGLSTNMEALTLSLPAFMEKYSELFKLVPNKPMQESKEEEVQKFTGSLPLKVKN